jgi:membrane protease subunit (stomatin/prohibitin family)
MGFWDKVRGEFVDVIEWTDDTPDTMVYRFERYGNEIKYGAKLTVREGQVAVLVNEGRIADSYQPGLYELETKNMPVLTTLMSWPHGFESPFKAEVYFFSTRLFTDLKWGTKNPVMLRDKEFGPVRLRAFGSYAVRVKDALTFLKEVVGTDGRFTTTEISNQLRNLIVSRFGAVLGSSGIPILDLAANYEALSDFVTKRIAPEFEAYGLELKTLLVENVSLPEEVEQALDKRTSMGIVGNLRDYAAFEAASAMGAAARNPAGGGAAEGLGIGAGIAMAQSLGQALRDAPNASASAASAPAASPGTPPPIPGEPNYYLAIGGHQTGPFSKTELRVKRASGDLASDTLVWTAGLAGWTEAASVSALAPIFAEPPPIPKQ